MKKVFGSENCPKCIQLKLELEKSEAKFVYYNVSDVDNKETMDAFTDAIAQAAFEGQFHKDSGLQLPLVVETDN